MNFVQLDTFFAQDELSFEDGFDTIDSNMKLAVPYFSYNFPQIRKAKVTEGEFATDGITCAKMLMEYFGSQPYADIDELVDFANSLGVCESSSFVKIDSLVIFLRVQGISAYKEYFRNTSIDLTLSTHVQNLYDIEAREQGIATIIASIAEGVPVMALLEQEVARDFETMSISSDEHLVVLFGYESKNGEVTGFYCHDPKNEKGESVFVPIDNFRNIWKRTAVFLEK